MILLDNRYEYDKATNDRLGEDQWLWLDSALQRGNLEKVDLTIIGAGIQIIPERANIPIEVMKWKNKKVLFDLLKKNQKDSVILLSGDVHFGQMYENKCKSLSG
jgi:alkaline phosphatase D